MFQIVAIAVIWRAAIPSLSKHVLPAAKRVGADLMEFAAPEFAEVVCGKKKRTAKIVRRRTLKQQLGSGSKQRRFFPTNSSKQASRSRIDDFAKLSPRSCQTIFDNNILWRLLETLAGKFQ